MRSGERVCLVGRNGEGKSSLLRIVNGELAPAAALAHAHSTQAIARLSDLQQQLEAVGAWTLEQRVEQTLSRLGLDGAVSLRSLSGGWRRRAMLARALVCDPDLLLLDAPTNHHNNETITWLEENHTSNTSALLFITHDRAFLRRHTTRIVELDRGQLT